MISNIVYLNPLQLDFINVIGMKFYDILENIVTNHLVSEYFRKGELHRLPLLDLQAKGLKICQFTNQSILTIFMLTEL